MMGYFAQFVTLSCTLLSVMDCGIHGVHYMVKTDVHSGLGHYCGKDVYIIKSTIYSSRMNYCLH